MKPTKNGYYWLNMPYSHLVSGETKWIGWEVVSVFMAVPNVVGKGRKPVDKVFGRHWNCPLEKIPDNAKWSEEILPPV